MSFRDSNAQPQGDDPALADLQQRVARGAQRLDDRAPGWRSRITQPIDVASTTHCPLGQCYGVYTVGRERAGLLSDGATNFFGFNGTKEELPLLSRIWTELVAVPCS